MINFNEQTGEIKLTNSASSKKIYHIIDFEKVKTIEDIILILKAMDLKVIVNSDYEISEEILEITKYLKEVE